MRVTSSTDVGKNLSWSGLKKHMDHDEKIKHENKFLETEESKNLRKFNKHLELGNFNKVVSDYMRPYVEDQRKMILNNLKKARRENGAIISQNQEIAFENTLTTLQLALEAGIKSTDYLKPLGVVNFQKEARIEFEAYKKMQVLENPEQYVQKTLSGNQRNQRLDKVCVVKFSNEEDWEKMQEKIAKNWDILSKKYDKGLKKHKISSPEELCAYMASRSLEKYMKTFSERNDNYIRAFSADIHVDEKGAPHAHYRALAMPDVETKYTKAGKVKSPRMGFSAGIREEMQAKYGYKYKDKNGKERKLSDKEALSIWREREDKKLVEIFNGNFNKLMGEDLIFYRKTKEKPDLTTGLAHDEYVRQKKTADDDFMAYRGSLISKRKILDDEKERLKTRENKLVEASKQIDEVGKNKTANFRQKGQAYVKSWALFEAKVNPKDYKKKESIWYTFLTEVCMLDPAEAMAIGDNLGLVDDKKSKKIEKDDEDLLEF